MLKCRYIYLHVYTCPCGNVSPIRKQIMETDSQQYIDNAFLDSSLDYLATASLSSYDGVTMEEEVEPSPPQLRAAMNISVTTSNGPRFAR